MSRLIFGILIVLITTSTTFPQTSNQTQSDNPIPKESASGFDAREFELQQEAARKASRISDPQSRLKAYEKMLIDFPKNPPVFIVNNGILDTYIQYWPKQTQRILELIDKTIDPTRQNMKTGWSGNIQNQIASELLDAGILTDVAQVLALRGLELFDQHEYIKFKKRQFTTWLKQPAPSDEELLKMFLAERAKNLTTLGRAYLKQGKNEEAGKLLREAYSFNPTIMETNTELAALAIKSNDDSAVVEYLTAAALSGRLTPELRKQLEGAYQRTHKGTLAGLEEMLDARYKLLMPNPISFEPYVPSQSRTDRVVLAEVFTGSGCLPCVSIDLAFDAELRRYRRQELAVLMYHLHVPAPDPMANPSTQARAKVCGFAGTPNFVIDGEKDTEGGGPRDATLRVFKRLESEIAKRLEVPSQARIDIAATFREGEIDAQVSISDVSDKQQESLRLQVALVEDELHYGGENQLRFHPMVVRSLAGTAGRGFPFDPSNPTVRINFNLHKISRELKAHLDEYEAKSTLPRPIFNERKDKINYENLSIVAFLQNDKNTQVLQTAFYKVLKSNMATGN